VLQLFQSPTLGLVPDAAEFHQRFAAHVGSPTHVPNPHGTIIRDGDNPATVWLNAALRRTTTPVGWHNGSRGRIPIAT
jgi:hypothetical protein